MDSKLELNFITVDDIRYPRLIEIKGSQKVGDLECAIKEKLNINDKLCLRKVETYVSLDSLEDGSETAAYELVLEAWKSAKLLEDHCTLATTFPELDVDSLHIIVELPILRINCFVLGESTDNVFQVEIASNESISAFKEVIINRKRHEFGHVDPRTLVLWDATMPTDKNFEENLIKLDLDNKKPLLPEAVVSQIFPISLEYRLHVVLEVPQLDFKLNCLVLGESVDYIFQVKIAPNESVFSLKVAIKDGNRPAFNHIDIGTLVLWDVSLPADQHVQENLNKLNLIDRQPLPLLQKVSKIFPRHPISGWLHVIVKPPPKEVEQVQPRVIEISSGAQIAVLKSWYAPYIGDAHRIFYDNATKRSQNDTFCVRYQSIIQSSGMGKSRMIDELSKEHLVIPINLRMSGTGFLPGDRGVLEFLNYQPFSPVKAYIRSHAFLIGLFHATFTVLCDFANNIAEESSEERRKILSAKFRKYMSDGQTFGRHGPNRVKFYTEVIQRANEFIRTMGSESLDVIASKFYPVLRKLLMLLDPNLPSFHDSLPEEPIMLLLAFDEAHSLAFPTTPKLEQAEEADRTTLSVMRHALRKMVDFPMFTVFLSTNPVIIRDFLPQPRDDPSGRLFELILRPVSPFTELGFDQMLKADNLEIRSDTWDIDFVSRVGFMVRFGRPLFGSWYKYGTSREQIDILKFGASKLCGGFLPNWKDIVDSPGIQLSLMSVRLALEFNSTSMRVRARELEHVEKHMRVCLHLHHNLETALTISPSEPILAEASRLIMLNNSEFNFSRSLLQHLEKLVLDKGDRGELVAKLLLILASDAAYISKKELRRKSGSRLPLMPVQAAEPELLLELEPTVPRAVSLELFIKELLAEKWHTDVLESLPAQWRTEEESRRSFQTTFQDAKIYFNHFIKIDDPRVINRDFLWRLIARGAAVLCADGQAGVDIIMPFTYHTGTLSRRTTSAIFVQLKNNAIFGSKPNVILFDLMNPYLLRFYDLDDENPLPIIRMVFALASHKAAVTAIPPKTEQPRQGARIQTDKANVKSPTYTAYDIWCAKACSDTFGIIKGGKEGDDTTYENLLKICKAFSAAYMA
ncbi:hypothetical protein AX17_003093 [Amanita inopinata Kibby_2008]|nr:hypothetical protein AX17_003093 [Amanita inopinata Kibby_2008]